MQEVLGWSHEQKCCNAYIYKVLEQTESFYSMQKVYFIREGTELLLQGLVFRKFHREL